MEPTNKKQTPEKEQPKNLNRLELGLVAGLLMPLLILLVTYTQASNEQSFVSFIEGMWHMKALVKLLSLCAMINLGVFMFFVKTNRVNSARGVLLATFVYAFIVLTYRVFV